MKKILIILTLVFGLTTGLALADEHSGEGNKETPESEKVEKKDNCKKACLERDGYGKCVKFEERCE